MPIIIYLILFVFFLYLNFKLKNRLVKAIILIIIIYPAKFVLNFLSRVLNVLIFWLLSALLIFGVGYYLLNFL